MKPLRAPQRGQSTIEFLVLALVLVPLFISVPLLGKYIDLMNASETAARYTAFEGQVSHTASAWKDDATLSVEVRRRIFSNPSAPIKTGDTAGDFTAHRNPLWSDHTGRPFLETYDATVAAHTETGSKNALAAAAFKGALGLPETNWRTATISVKPVQIPEFAPFDALNLDIQRKAVLLSDAWTAKDLGDVRGRIFGSLAIYPVSAFAPVLDPLGEIPPTLFDPSFRIGDFDWDIVPCDRLVGGCTP